MQSHVSKQASVRDALSGPPQPFRWALVGAALAGFIGGVVGLVVGLVAYPPTAWFAVFELGVPSALVGVGVGFAAGGIALAVRRDSWTPPSL